MAKPIACEQCHRPATHKGTNSHGSNFFCSACIASNEAIGDEIDAHEMKHFGGAYGLVERMHYEPLASDPGFIRADLVDELVKALEHARESLGIFADCVSDHTQIRQDISDDLAKIDAALTRIKGDGK